jgi:hypothetical protein
LPLPIIAIFAVPFLIALIAFIGFRFLGSNTIKNEVIVPDAPNVYAMAALPGGGFVYGERDTGRIFTAAAPDGRPEVEPLTQIEVSSGEDAGLLGLAVDRQGQTFASYIDKAGFLTLSAVEEGSSLREVWRGPVPVGGTPGGRIAFNESGDLIMGISHLGRPELVDDVSTLNGKFVILDPAASPDQLPKVLSGGWHEPVAFTVTEADELWVVDNAPEDESEVIARGDLADGPERITGIRDRLAPTGLASADDETLVFCSAENGELGVFKIDARGIAYTLGRFPTLATDCKLGVVALSDGRLIYSTGSDIRIAKGP